MQIVLEDNADHSDINDEIRRLLACFYADNSMMTCRNPDLLLHSFNTLTGLFDRVGMG